MRPLRLEMQAFGPFPGKEVVDFNDLSKNGLFLICGETGSGKTTILDAMTFALYGKGTNELRNSLESMRCQFEDKIDTYILLDLECKGHVYRFETRLSKKRTNLLQTQQVYKLVDDVFEPQFENCRKEDIYKQGNKKVPTSGFTYDLIGLDYNQFKQIVILPQGQFERFLVAKSDEKEEILSKIFDVQKWENIAELFFTKASAKKEYYNNLKKTIEIGLDYEGVQTLEAFEKYIQKIKSDLAEMESAYKARDLKKEREEIETLKTLSSQFKELQLRQRRRSDLEGKAPTIQSLMKRNEMASQANAFEQDIKELTSLQEALKQRSAASTSAKKKVFKKKEELETAQNDLTLHLQKKESMDQISLNIGLYESKKDLYRKVDSARKKHKDAMQAYKKAKKILEEKEQLYKEESDKYATLSREWQKLSEEHQSMFVQYNAGLYGEIAASLEENQPCPVCGSIHHPQPAERIEGTPSKEQVQLKKKEADTKYKEAKEQEEKIPELDSFKQMKSQKEIEMNQAKAELDAIHSELIQGIDSLSSLEKKITEMKSTVQSYESTKSSLETKKGDAGIALAGAEESLDSANREYKKVQEQYQEASTLFEEKLKQSSFESVDALKKAMLKPSEIALNERKIGEYNEAVRQNNQDIQNYSERIGDRYEPDIKAIEAKEREINQFENTYTKDAGILRRQIQEKEEKYQKIAGLLEEYESNILQVDSDLKLAKSIRGDTGIGLKRYVLGVMFNTVISAANQMLTKVHDGRYRLYNNPNKKGYGNKKGLELYVRDYYNTEEAIRHVSYLSGGEKFLVSLSLSIGLSSVAQSSGNKLDAMFIDEGFGTLSNTSIDDAIGILMEIKKSAGVIGIISHVQLLRDNIPTKLEIHKTKSGSSIKKNIG